MCFTVLVVDIKANITWCDIKRKCILREDESHSNPERLKVDLNFFLQETSVQAGSCDVLAFPIVQ